MDKFKNHPYFDDHNIINKAFEELMNEQKHNFEILRGYKGALTEQAIEQMYWEDKRIMEVKKKVLNLYSKSLIENKL